MYLSHLADLQVLPSSCTDVLLACLAMLQRGLLCLTAFLATSSSFLRGNNVVAGVEAQFLLGLGELHPLGAPSTIVRAFCVKLHALGCMSGVCMIMYYRCGRIVVVSTKLSTKRFAE